MKIKKDTKLEVHHSRKGIFTGVAMEDFDTTYTEWFPIAVMGKTVKGVSHFTEWNEGDGIPCRNTLCTLKVLD